MAKAVMFLGTGSDVGKSIAATAFCRIFKRRGFKVAPFKAQNMSNNSYVTIEGGEIGRAQVAQAEAAGVVPSVHMNPVLLKPSSGQKAQIVIQGHVTDSMSAMEYHLVKSRMKYYIMDSYKRLDREYEIIVLEGAGSCCEMNLKENDIANFYMAEVSGSPCILVADIDRGGVFAQTIGTFNLMNPGEKRRTLGFLINKFRGDARLFSAGIEYIEVNTHRRVLGLVPFFEDIHIDSEDSVAVQEGKRVLRNVGPGTINIAVIRMPAISNFTDLEILEREPDIVVNYISRPGQLTSYYDCLIIPGTKNVIEDAIWLARMGWKRRIFDFVSTGKRLLGICGGYQLLGKKIRDPLGLESEKKETTGLSLLPIETILEEKKVVGKAVGTCLINGKKVKGYEIHMGKSRIIGAGGGPLLRIRRPDKNESWEDGWAVDSGKIVGTYLHGILDSPGFRNEFLNNMRKDKGLKARFSRHGRDIRFHHYDLLADHFETHCDVQKIVSAVMGR